MSTTHGFVHFNRCNDMWVSHSELTPEEVSFIEQEDMHAFKMTYGEGRNWDPYFRFYPKIQGFLTFKKTGRTVSIRGRFPSCGETIEILGKGSAPYFEGISEGDLSEDIKGKIEKWKQQCVAEGRLWYSSPALEKNIMWWNTSPVFLPDESFVSRLAVAYAGEPSGPFAENFTSTSQKMTSHLDLIRHLDRDIGSFPISIFIDKLFSLSKMPVIVTDKNGEGTSREFPQEIEIHCGKGSRIAKYLCQGRTEVTRDLVLQTILHELYHHVADFGMKQELKKVFNGTNWHLIPENGEPLVYLVSWQKIDSLTDCAAACP